jgi:beta-lactamase superfamily II metal-dependent hydrolase
MADKLLIRLFDVGLGDCIYCRIPQGHESGRDFHMLIDCGTLSSTSLLRDAIEALKPLLPEDAGKRHIDLLVVTHEHKDHMTGFGLDIWDELSFGAIWMSAAMDLNHPESTRTKKLHGFAASAMTRALQLNIALGLELTELARVMAANDDAMNNLRKTLPQANGVAPKYVHADSPANDLELPLRDARLSVLAPEYDIDYYYLGDEGDPDLRHSLRFIDSALPNATAAVPDESAIPMPGNLDPADFRNLRSRMLSTALAFAQLDGKVCNNTSIVLLLEWKNKRVLFVGDAEWDNAFKPGSKGNCSWNVMWNRHRDKLAGALAFLKIGHHGSENATPWAQTEAAGGGEPAAILDAILPVTSKDDAQAVVSTRRATYKTIPRTALLAEIGTRVANTRNYAAEFKDAGLKTSDVPRFGEFEKTSFTKPQPWRTDLETMVKTQGFVEVEIEA